MQTKYLVGIAMVISILAASFAGFGLAHFEYQPQIENVKTQLSQLNSTVNDLRSDISALEANDTTLKSENAALNENVTKLRSDIDGLQSNVSSLETKYDMLYNENLALNETMRALRSSTTVLNGTVMKLNDSVNILRFNMSALEADYNALQVKNSILTGNVTQLSGAVDSLQSDVTALEAKCSMLQSQNAVLNETVKKLSNYIDNISFATDSSYYIFKQNNTYCAKSGLDGEIKYRNESCSQVINYALAHVPYGGAVLFEPLPSANDAYYIDNAIRPPNGTTLASENSIVTICLDNKTNQDVIDLDNVMYVQIRNIQIDGNARVGNRWNNTSGNGIVIQGNFRGSDDLIENVVIENCNGTGIWVENTQLGNAFSNVQVYYSGAYNIRVDSADNQFIDVESGSAGLSGFDVTDVDNYFLNCITWGCGLAGNPSDCDGFSISGARNMFVGCNADRNARGGFVLPNANQTMLASCIGRDNGQRYVGSWGFDLYNSFGTVMSACVATDEQHGINKTQNFGFTEGGNSDYNTVTGCDFEGNKVGAVDVLIGTHSVIEDTIGYETRNLGYTNFRYLDEPINIGTNNTYGTPRNFTSKTGTIVDFHLTIGWSNLTINENVTVRVQALMANGTMTSLEISRNGNSIKNNTALATYVLTEEDASELWSNSNTIQEILISATTTENVTGAAISVYLWGSGS